MTPQRIHFKMFSLFWLFRGFLIFFPQVMVQIIYPNQETDEEVLSFPNKLPLISKESCYAKIHQK